MSLCGRVNVVEGLLSYSVRHGAQRGVGLSLSDHSYDGSLDNDTAILTGGLGQLTDGVEGPSNFRLGAAQLGRRGYEWVGWKNESASVQLMFEFEAVRNFSVVSIHTNNMFNRDVRLFRRAVMQFAVQPFQFDETPEVAFDVTRDSENESARNVIIPISNRVARFVKMQLFFDAKWMLISEVSFQSGTHPGTLSW